MKIIQEFKEFAIKGNMMDMAVGIIIGGAFGTIVKSMVDDLIMPPLGLVLGRIQFNDMFLVMQPGTVSPGPYVTLAEAKEAGAVTLNYGNFITNAISFVILAFVIFLLVRAMNRLRRSFEKPDAEAPIPTTKECPFCCTFVDIRATRCPHCTSELVPA